MIISVGKEKEKWCPFDKEQASPRVYSAGACLGPECMMWHFKIPPLGFQSGRKFFHLREIWKARFR
jgi:hypothetical protein